VEDSDEGDDENGALRSKFRRFSLTRLISTRINKYGTRGGKKATLSALNSLNLYLFKSRHDNNLQRPRSIHACGVSR
jgi:hypothetical protein